MKIDFETLKDSLSMTAVAEQFTGLKRIGGEMHGPCPICQRATTDGFFVRRDDRSWGCRKCQKGGDVLDFVQAVKGCEIKEAYEFLTGRTFPDRKPQAEDAPNWRETAWQEEARAEIEATVKAMVGTAGASLGWKYLQGRGIKPETMSAFQIGFKAKRCEAKDQPTRPAVCLPWVLEGGLVCTLKYRFCDETAAKDKSRRFNKKRGGDMVLFGSHLVKGATDQNSLLILVEGEINCMSIYQAAKEEADVVSFGSDANGAHKSDVGLQAALSFAKSRGYGRILIWCDDEEKGKRAGTIFQGLNVKLVKSPRGKDANDILNLHGEQGLREFVESLAPPRLCSIVRDFSNFEAVSPGEKEGERQQDTFSQDTGFYRGFKSEIEYLYRLAPPEIKRVLMDLEDCTLARRNEARAIELALVVDQWIADNFAASGKVSTEPMLEGPALRAKIIELFNVKEAA